MSHVFSLIGAPILCPNPRLQAQAGAAFGGGDEWDQAAPMGVNVKKQKGVKKPQTIIEEIIAAASKTAGDASYNSLATVSDDRCGKFEKFVWDSFLAPLKRAPWIHLLCSLLALMSVC